LIKDIFIFSLSVILNFLIMTKKFLNKIFITCLQS